MPPAPFEAHPSLEGGGRRPSRPSPPPTCASAGASATIYAHMHIRTHMAHVHGAYPRTKRLSSYLARWVTSTRVTVFLNPV